MGVEIGGPETTFEKFSPAKKYIGNLTYNRTSLRLQSKRIYHPKDEWIRIEGTMEPIVDRTLFASAQLLLNETWALSDTDLLDYLTAAWCVTGYLSSGNMHRIKYAPAINTYVARFGSLANAYRLIGYKTSHNYRYAKIRDLLRKIHQTFFVKFIVALFASLSRT